MNDQNNRIYDKLEKIDEKFDRKFDKLDGRIDSIDKELVIYNEQLKHHIEGVRQLERENNMLREYIDSQVQKVIDDFEPVVSHVNKMQNISEGLLKIWSFFKSGWALISVIAGAIYTILKLIQII